MQFQDQMHRTIRLDEPPKRVVSLVPSQTELLHYLGLETEVVGITKFCIHPASWFQTKNRVGGTKNISMDKVKALNPDFIIGNKEENTPEDIEALSAIAPIYMSDVNTIKDAFQFIKDMGELFQLQQKTKPLLATLQNGFSAVNNIVKHQTVAYLIWQEPYLLAGKNTFIDAMLSHIGFTNWTDESRYPEWNQKAKKDPDFIFLSSEPFPFHETHRHQLQTKYPNSKVVLVDGELFSWYGSRMLAFPDYVRQLLNQLGIQ